jgi:hypothetical protein
VEVALFAAKMSRTDSVATPAALTENATVTQPPKSMGTATIGGVASAMLFEGVPHTNMAYTIPLLTPVLTAFTVTPKVRPPERADVVDSRVKAEFASVMDKGTAGNINVISMENSAPPPYVKVAPPTVGAPLFNAMLFICSMDPVIGPLSTFVAPFCRCAERAVRSEGQLRGAAAGTSECKRTQDAPPRRAAVRTAPAP